MINIINQRIKLPKCILIENVPEVIV